MFCTYQMIYLKWLKSYHNDRCVLLIHIWTKYDNSLRILSDDSEKSRYEYVFSPVREPNRGHQ